MEITTNGYLATTYQSFYSEDQQLAVDIVVMWLYLLHINIQLLLNQTGMVKIESCQVVAMLAD